MPSQVVLSDGSTIDVPDGTPDDVVTRAAAQGEAQIGQRYTQQAIDTNAPVTAGSKVYSATTVYPNTYLGQGMAWLDHNAGGNWMNRNIVQPVNQATGGAADALAGSVGRIETNAVAGGADLPAAGLNTLKHVVAPGRGTEGDIPYIGQSIRGEVGVPELPANAPLAQRAVEAGLGGYLGSPSGAAGLIKNLVYGGLGTAGSTAGGWVGGEPGSFLGGLLATGGPAAAGKAAAKVAGPAVAAPNAAGTWNAATSIRPTTPGGNFQGLPGQAPGGVDYSQFMPSFTALANPTGQRVAAGLGSIPYSGKPIEQASEDTSNFIKTARDAAAADLAGPQGLPVGGASPATIGPVLTSGAQTAIGAIRAQQKAQQDAMDTLMQGREVPVASTISAGANAVSGNQRGIPETTATWDRLGDLQNAAPGGADYNRAPVPLPAMPTVPWSNLKDWVGGLNASLQSSGRPALPDDIATALKAAANLSRAQAAEAVQPGAGAQFLANNESYARSLVDQDQLSRFAGEPLGSSGQFTNVPGEQSVAGQVTNNLQSPGALAILSHPAFPADARLNVAGQVTSTLGNASQGGFRPERFADQYGAARPGLEALTGGPTGQTAPLDVLDQAATIGQNFSTPPSRYGLIKSLGGAGTVATATGLTSRAIEHAAPWKPAQYLGVPQMGRWYASMLENPALKRAMAGQPQDWSSLANQIPVAGAVTNTEASNRLALQNRR